MEGASCVLICMSEKYKASANCRLEGNYVHEQKVPFVPLLLQEGYKPSGEYTHVAPPTWLQSQRCAHCSRAFRSLFSCSDFCATGYGTSCQAQPLGPIAKEKLFC